MIKYYKKSDTVKTMNKTEKIRKIYAIAIGVFVVAMGIALICVAAEIYYSNSGFPREIVIGRLQAMAIPFIILIGAIAVGAIFPLYEVKAKFTSENAVRLLSPKLPESGEGEDYEAAAAKHKKLKNVQLGLWIGEGALLLGCIIAVLCYMLNTAHFLGTNITGEIFKMVQNVLPWIAVAFATLIAATVANGYISSRLLKEIKLMIKNGNGVPATPSENKYIATIKNVLRKDLTLWIVRGIIFVIAVTFIILGICNGGAHDVLVKAINICTECIGLG